VPFAAIKNVVKLPASEFEKQRNRNFLKQRPLFENLFEIKLNCNFEDIYNYRNAERQSLYQSKSAMS
jgi:hypothetical protein